jgi:hypothetical protein
MREAEVERTCWPVAGGFCCEDDRFMAEAGIGIAEALWLIEPSVCVL